MLPPRFRQAITARLIFSPGKINSSSYLSSERISRLRPNLQQFSCTFVKPMKAPLGDIPG